MEADTKRRRQALGRPEVDDMQRSTGRKLGYGARQDCFPVGDHREDVGCEDAIEAVHVKWSHTVEGGGVADATVTRFCKPAVAIFARAATSMTVETSRP